MGRRKRPLPEEFKADGSTDALCRAVKRLHTHSKELSSCNTASKDAELGGIEGEEASSSFQGPGGKSMPHQPGPGEPGTVNRLGVGHGRPAVDQSDEGGIGWSKGGRGLPPPLSTGKPQWSRPAGLGIPDNDDRIQGGQASEEGVEEEEVRQGLAEIDVTRAPGGEEAVPQPSTPSREEVASPSAKKGHRLGTRENGTCREYEELYEEANNLLKNLHFEWLHRKSSQN